MIVTPCCHFCGSQTFERDWPRRATGLAAFLRPSGALGLSTLLYHGLAPVATYLRPSGAWAFLGPHEPRAGARGYMPSPLSGLFGVSSGTPLSSPVAKGGKSGGEGYTKGENALALVVRLRERYGLVESCRGGCRDSPLENGLMGVSLGRESTRFVAVMA